VYACIFPGEEESQEDRRKPGGSKGKERKKDKKDELAPVRRECFYAGECVL
jgi:hypothetical protein